MGLESFAPQAFEQMQEINTMMKERRTATLRQMIASKATELPISMSKSRQVAMKETEIMLRGISQPGVSFQLLDPELV